MNLTPGIFNDKHQFYFIRHLPWAGGNHVANIMSLDPMFAPRFGEDREHEFNRMLAVYQDSKTFVHHDLTTRTDIGGSGIWSVPEYVFNYSASAHRGHAGGFLWDNSWQLVKNKRFISMTFNTEASVDAVRYREKQNVKTDTFANSYYAKELAMFYSQPFEEPGVDSRETNFYMETAEIFKPDLSAWIERINRFFDLSIPIKQAEILHSIWLKKNTPGGKQ